MAATKYPHIKVKLIGTDGNSFALISKVTMAMRKNKIDEEAIDEFYAEATKGNYDHLLSVIMDWVTVR